MVGCKEFKALGQHVELVLAVELGHADAHARLTASCGRQGDCSHAIADQFCHELAAGHALVAHRVEESVTDRLISVHRVNDMEAIVDEHLLADLRPAGILGSGSDEVKLAVGGGA